MAGDWIKMNTALDTHPKVVSIAAALDLDELHVVGLLHKVWSWADQHSLDGNALSVTYSFLNRITRVSGFAEALRDVEWLCGDEGSLTFPRFHEHNGKTAKSRAQTARRVANHKKGNAEGNAKGNAESNAESNATSVTSALPREEKRRDNKYIYKPRAGNGPSEIEKQIATLLAYFNISTPVPMIGSQAMAAFMDQPQFLSNEGLAGIRANAAAWMAQDWIKNVSPKLIASHLAEIYNFSPKAKKTAAERDRERTGLPEEKITLPRL
jgi:hypothetical protein